MRSCSQTYRHHFRQLVSYHFPEHYINALRLVIGGEMEGRGGREWREGGREGRREGGREGEQGGRESRGVEGEDRNKLEQEE